MSERRRWEGWLRSYWLLTEWHMQKLRPWIIPILLFQVATGVGATIGLGFLLPHISPETALYLSSGGPTAMLLSVGLAVVPATVTRAKEVGVIDYMMTLPIPRLAYLIADLTVWCVLTLPGVVMALATAIIRYDIEIHVDALLVPAAALTLVTAASIGYVYALVSPSQMITSAVSNFVILFVFLLSPINFPADRLPPLLSALHEILPIRASAELIRANLGGAAGVNEVKSTLLLIGWAVAMLITAHRVMSRQT